MKHILVMLQPERTRQTNMSRSLRALRRSAVTALFLLPACVLFTMFVIYPILSSFYYSLTSWDGLSPNVTFVGLANFQALFSDSTVLVDLKNTVGYALGVVLLQNSIALLLAVILDSILPRLTFLRVLFLIPALLSALSIGYIWSYLYSPLFGFVNSMLGHIGLAGWQQDWLGNPRLALPSIMLTGTWHWVGFTMIIYLAGLQSVPSELYEAASIDGAHGWQRFRHITFPLIAPSVTVNVLLTLIGGLKVFDTIIAMTGGGPDGASESLAVRIYKEAFSMNHFGYATAIGIVMSGIILAVSVLNLRVLRKREVEY